MELKDETVIFRYTNQSTTTEDPLSVNLNNGQWHSVEIFEQADGQLLASFDNTTVPLLNQFSFVEFMQSNDSWLTFGRSQNATGFKVIIHFLDKFLISRAACTMSVLEICLNYPSLHRLTQEFAR